MSSRIDMREHTYESLPEVAELITATNQRYSDLLAYLDQLQHDDFVPAIASLTQEQLSEKLSLIETHSLRLGFDEMRVVAHVRQLDVLGLPQSVIEGAMKKPDSVE